MCVKASCTVINNFFSENRLCSLEASPTCAHREDGLHQLASISWLLVFQHGLSSEARR